MTGPINVSNNLLAVSGLSKTYASLVLDQVDLEIQPAEVHALVGENGAGKSTLARIIAGLTRPSDGRMTLRGQPFAPASKKEAEHLGVRLVMQELNLIGNLSVAENIFFDQLPHRCGWVNYNRLNSAAAKIMAEVGLGGVQPGRLINTLGVGQQQLIEIAAGLSRHCHLLILDEPTAALTGPEIERLFQQVAKLRRAGISLIYISHRLEEIQQIADRVTVLRDGRVVTTRPINELSLNQMVQLMVGRDLGQAVHRPGRSEGPVALRVQKLRAGTAVKDVSFEVRRGEILGFAGLMGSGRTETMRAIFGADRADSGEVYIHDLKNPVRIRSPHDAVRSGVALMTEDRKVQGLFLPLSVRSNVTLTRLPSLSWGRMWLRSSREAEEATRWSRTLNVRSTSVEQRVVELSGGNQQKVVIAKWLFRDCDVLIFDEPTRGIDVGAKFEIYQVLSDLAAKGKAVVVVSSDLKELLAICDRIAVMSAGRIAGCFRRDEWSEEKIMAAAFSGYVRQVTDANNSR